MIDYKLLEAMAAVIECGTFEKASAKLNITQSAVSQRIKLLEEQTGQLLLIRSTPPQPTEIGTQYLKHFKQVSHLERGLVKENQNKVDQYQSISLAINADSLNTWFFEAIKPYLNKHDVVLELYSEDQDVTHNLLREGKVISFIGTQSRAIQGCQQVYLGSVRYEFIASKTFRDVWFGDGLTYDNAIKAPIIFYNKDDYLNHTLFKAIFGQECQTINNFYIPSTERFADLINADLAYGALPEHQTESLMKDEAIIKLFNEHHINIDLYFHFWNIKSPLLRSFAEHLISSTRTILRNTPSSSRR